MPQSKTLPFNKYITKLYLISKVFFTLKDVLTKNVSNKLKNYSV